MEWATPSGNVILMYVIYLLLENYMITIKLTAKRCSRKYHSVICYFYFRSEKKKRID